MDRIFNEVRSSVKKQAPAFIEYLRLFVLDDLSYRILMDISSKTDVYVFSGVIRNYLLGEPTSRDIDIVVRNLSALEIPQELLCNYQIARNSFGGYKVRINDLNIDIWDIESTWTLLHNPSLKPTPNTLIKTAFFNFSAIVYDVNRRRFIFGHEFLNFYKYREIDVVNEINPNEALCIVNTMYYAIKIESPIRYKLCKWIVKHYSASFDYELVQQLHFHKTLYTNEQVGQFYKACCTLLPQLKLKPGIMALSITDSSQ